MNWQKLASEAVHRRWRREVAEACDVTVKEVKDAERWVLQQQEATNLVVAILIGGGSAIPDRDAVEHWMRHAPNTPASPQGMDNMLRQHWDQGGSA